MAILYVDNDGSTTWSSVYSTLAAAISAWSSGDVIWVSVNHDETISANIADGTGTTAQAPIPIFSVTPSGTTGGTYTPATSAQFTINGAYDFQVTADIYGIYFSYGANNFTIGDQTGSELQRFSDCTFYGTGAANYMLLAGKSNLASEKLVLYFTNCLFTGNANCNSALRAQSATMVLKGCKFEATDQSTGVISLLNAYYGVNTHILIGCDFSAIGASVPLVDLEDRVTYKLYNCKLPASATLAYSANPQARAEFVACDSGTGRYLTQVVDGLGTIIATTTTYYDSGWNETDGILSATPADQRFSFLMTPSATYPPTPFNPLRSLPIMTYVDSAGAKTVTVECLIDDFGTSPDKTELWIEVIYLGTDGSTLANYGWTSDSSTPPSGTSSRITGGRELSPDLSGGTALSAGAGLANWTGEPTGASSVKLTAGITVNEPGFVQAIVCLGRSDGGVVYYDPTLTIS